MLSLRTGHKTPWPTKCDLSLCAGKPQCPHSYTSCPPANLDEYKAFTRALATHFKGKINYYIIENEVNTLTFWLGTKEEYLALRKAAYEGIHAGNPSAVVIDNGIASGAWIQIVARDKFCQEGKNAATQFLAESYAREFASPEIRAALVVATFSCHSDGTPVLNPESERTAAIFENPDTFDYMSFHFYEPWPLEVDIINWIKKRMSKLGYSKPLILSEGGYFDSLTSALNSDTKQKVAKDLVKIQTTAFGEGVKQFVWLPAVQKNEDSTTFNNYKGLYTENGSSPILLPAGTAYKLMISKIGDFTNAQKLVADGSLFIYKFTVTGKTVLIAWSEKETPMEIDFSSYFSGATSATDYLGKSLNFVNKKLILTDSPVYIQ